METSISNFNGNKGTPNKTRSHQRKDPTSINDPDTSKTETERGGEPNDPTGSTEAQNISRPNLVIQPPPEGTEPKQRSRGVVKKKKRNRPSGMKYDKTAKNEITTALAGLETVVMVQSVLQGLFAIVATRAGAHWVITEDEAETIATPAANIIARYIDIDKMAKYSDPAALMIALGVVIVPRVTINVSKKGGKPSDTGLRTIPNPRTEQPSNKDARDSWKDGRTDSRTVDGNAGPNVETNVDELLRLANNQPY